MRYGYKASAEQFDPQRLLDYSRLADELGLHTVAISDHFQPWRHHGGHAPNSFVWLGALGQRTERVTLATSVLTPTLRYQPPVQTAIEHMEGLRTDLLNRMFGKGAK